MSALGIKSLVTKKRGGKVKLLILLQLLCFLIYWLVIETNLVAIVIKTFLTK
jgi:hypothetical protein